ncbi:hypothetical protein F2P81_003043 [Scophthalmus maximus]|uniref:Uncharacterized protein n=1 Tax=Scophthalmus maximus TaxID=52904 RepID=A0A6A4TF81_SCOMX|nr:hypothetical protein F2P81_003043 [Scophthalmus maximus]
MNCNSSDNKAPRALDKTRQVGETLDGNKIVVRLESYSGELVIWKLSSLSVLQFLCQSKRTSLSFWWKFVLKLNLSDDIRCHESDEMFSRRRPWYRSGHVNAPRQVSTLVRYVCVFFFSILPVRYRPTRRRFDSLTHVHLFLFAGLARGFRAVFIMTPLRRDAVLRAAPPGGREAQHHTGFDFMNFKIDPEILPYNYFLHV